MSEDAAEAASYAARKRDHNMSERRRIGIRQNANGTISLEVTYEATNRDQADVVAETQALYQAASVMVRRILQGPT